MHRYRRLIAGAALCAAAGRLAAQQPTARIVRGLDFVGNHAVDDQTLSTVIVTTRSSYFARAAWIRWLGFGEKRTFDELEFRRDVIRLTLYYRVAGFMQATVDTTVRRSGRDVFVKFLIYEGQPIRVRHLEVTGVDSVLEPKRLRKAMPLQSGQPFNRFLVQAAADTVVAWLRDRGHPYAEVYRNFDVSPDEQWADVTLEAAVGPRMHVGAVLVTGVEHVDTHTVRRTVGVRPGDLFAASALLRGQRDLYGTGLFRFAGVVLLDSTPPTHGDSLARVGVDVREGPTNRVRASGGYGSVDCFRASSGWSRYGFLGDARVFDVSGTVSKIGVGYPLDAGFRDNVCQYLKGDPTSDTLNYTLTATLFQPTLLSPRHTANLALFTERRSQYQVYTRIQRGANVTATFNARRRLPFSLTYTFTKGRTDADDAVFCSVFTVCDSTDQEYLRTTRPYGALTLGLLRRAQDNLLDPTTGSTVTASMTYASPHLGSDSLYQFLRMELELVRYYPVGHHGVLSWRAAIGAITPGGVRLQGQDVSYVPPEQRFYAGGANSVRGYRANELGPVVYVTTDTTNFQATATDTVYGNVRAAPTGGNSLLLGSVEYRFGAPLAPGGLRFGIFVDLGQVYNRANEALTFSQVRFTPGVGLRFATPLGPVRLDVAYNGNDAESGPLLYQNDATGEISEYRGSYRPPKGKSFWRRLQFQFAIGQAF